MQPKTRYYLYRFKLFINNILIPNCPDQQIQITWNSPHYTRTYSNPEYFFKSSEAKIQTEINLEEILIKQDNQSSFLSLESEIRIEKYEQNGSQSLATLKIDLHDLAMSDHFHQIKTLSMFSPLSQDSWIGIGIFGIQYLEISENQAQQFGTNRDVPITIHNEAETVEIIQKSDGINLSKKRSNTDKARKLQNYQTIMKLINGKDHIISQLQQKAIFLISLVKQTKNKLTLLQNQQPQKNVISDLPSQIRSNRSRSVSIPKPSSRKQLSVKNISVLVKQSSLIKQKDNVTLIVPNDKSKLLVQEQINQIENEYKDIIEDLQNQKQEYRQRILVLESGMEQLKQAKTSIYQTKKKNILIGQQNQYLKKIIEQMEFKLKNQNTYNQLPRQRMLTQKTQGRVVTCASMDDEHTRMDAQIYKMKQKALLDEIQRLRVKVRESDLQAFQLKRKQSYRNQKQLKTKDSFSIQQQINARMTEVSKKYAEEEIENKKSIAKLSIQISQLLNDKKNLQRQVQSLTKKNEYLKEQYQHFKQTNRQNQKKLLILSRLQNKNKQLQEFNKKLQSNIQRQEIQLRQKHKQLLEFSYNRTLPTLKIKQQRSETLIQGQNSNQMRKKASHMSNIKRSELRNNIMEMGNIIKDNKQKLDSISKDQVETIEMHEKILKDSKTKMKNLIEQLNIVEEQPSTPASYRNQFGNRWQAQQILQQNNQLKAYVKTLLKKVVALQTITPPNKLDLELKSREIAQNQRRLLESIEDILVQTSEMQQLQKQSFVNNVSNIKQLYSEQMSIVQQQLKRIVDYKHQLSELQTSLNKREQKLNIIEHMSTSKRLSAILPENKWREADLAEFAEIKKRQKQLKIKLNNTQSKILTDKMQADKQKQQIVKKCKQEQKKLLTEAKQANDKQLSNWKNEISELERRLRQKQIEAKQFIHQNQLFKTTLENEQRMNNMRVSQHNLKTHDMSNSIQQITQQLKNEITKNKYSLQTIKQLNGNINKLTSSIQNKQSEYEYLQDQYKEFREESEDLVIQMESKYKQIEFKLKQENNVLIYQIQRLKFLVEDQVIKSVKFQDEYKVICQTINQLQLEIQQLNATIQHKQQIIENMHHQYQLKGQEVKVMEEEYNQVLISLGEENKRYASLKGEYTSLQLLHQKTEDFITTMENNREEDRKQFEEILDQRDKQKRGMLNQINDMLRKNAQNDISYRNSINDYEIHIRKIEEELKISQNNQIKLEEEIQVSNRERQDLRNDNAALVEELERFGKRDKKKKKTGFSPTQAISYPINPSNVQFSKVDVEKQPSYAGSGVEGHKSSSIEYDHARGNQQYQQLFTPMSTYQRGSPLHDQASQQQFLYPSHKSHRGFISQDHPQIKVTDENGQQVGRCMIGRSGSMSGKAKFFPKQPLQQVHEQSIQKLSKQHSKDYQKSELNNSSDDDSEQRKEQIQNLQKTIQNLNKQLAEKKLIIVELQAINRKNQNEMIQTKRYLQNSLKRKGTHKRSFKDIDPLSPVNSIPKQSKQSKEQNISESLKEMQFIGEQLDALQEQLKAEKELNSQYQKHMQEMKQQLLLQQADHTKLLKLIEELQQQLIEHKTKEQQLFHQIQKLTSQLAHKNQLIVQFQQVIKTKQEQKLHTEKVIYGLQGQLSEVLKYKQRLEQGLEQTTEQLMMKEKECANIQNLRQELSKKVQQLNDELFQSKQESDAKNSIILEYEGIIKHNQQKIQGLQADIESMADKYLLIQEVIKSQKQELEEYGNKFKVSHEKHQQTLKKLFGLERQKGLLELNIKQLENTISFKEKQNNQIRDRIKQYEAEIAKQASMFQRQRGQLFEDQKQLQDHIKSKQVNIEVLKNDVLIILKQNKQLKEQREKIQVDDQASTEEVKTLVKSFELEIGMEKARVIGLQEEIKRLTQVVSSQKRQLDQINEIENMRGSLIDEVQKNNRQYVVKLQGELRSINQQIQKRMQLNAEQLKFQYEQKLAIKDRDYNQLKLMHQKQKKVMQEQRYEMFSKKCQLEQTRISMAEKQQDYKYKIQKYEGSIKQICGKLKNIQTERPQIQLFEEVAFQNQIFRNRITQLQEIVSFKETVNNQYYIQQLQQMKSRFFIERQEYMNELQNYSAQVAELQQKNYQLTSQLQQMRYDDYYHLKEQNIELEKSVTRLQTCEQQLRKQLQLLKVKREQQYKQYLSDLRTLRSK